MSPEKKRVIFIFGGDWTQLMKKSAEGLAPDEFLYGLPYFVHPTLDVDFIDDRSGQRRLTEYFWVWLHRIFAWRFTMGFYSPIYWRNREKIQAADIIVTTKDSVGLPILWQKYSGKIKGKVIYISQGLYKIAEKATQSKINERIYCQIGKWLKEAEFVIVFGEGDAQALKNSFANCAPINPQIILFGIDEKFWKPGNVNISNDEGYILSVGSDSLRDYSLLLKAIGDHPLRIVTRQTLPRDLLRPTITKNSDLDWVELRDWYRGSKFVVIPIKNEPRNSGHSATLQGMACGKAVILSETPGLWDRERMKHLETCYLVKPENVEALKEAISFLLAHPDEAARIGENARKLVEDHYRSKMQGELLREYALSLP